MTAPARVGCAARTVYRDKHQCVGTWWTVTSPAGETYELCSGACLVTFATLGALPADLETGHCGTDPEREAAA